MIFYEALHTGEPRAVQVYMLKKALTYMGD